MGFLGRFGKKKKEEKPVEEVKKTPSDLELICADDKEVYEALKETMLLNPGLIKESMEELAKKAEELEKSGDPLRASIHYKTAGGLAIFQGNVPKVEEFFNKCEKLSGRKYPITKIAERSVSKAQEYQKHLKETEKK